MITRLFASSLSQDEARLAKLEEAAVSAQRERENVDRQLAEMATQMSDLQKQVRGGGQLLAAAAACRSNTGLLVLIYCMVDVRSLLVFI